MCEIITIITSFDMPEIAGDLITFGALAFRACSLFRKWQAYRNRRAIRPRNPMP